MPEFGPPLSPQDLQFQHAEPIGDAASEGSAQSCAACKQPVGDTFYQAQSHVVCPACAARIQAAQQAAPPLSLMRAALYGGAAALGGCAVYALVAIVLHAEIGIIAILVGWMVGKAIRHASYGRGGRPQQILAVVLTYFAITTSYIPVIVYHLAKGPPTVEQQQQAPAQRSPSEARPRPNVSGLALYLLMLAAVAPFLQLTSGFGGLISLFILFIGLRYAWKLTERREIPLAGPYQVEATQ
jgi:hypothetical protein